MALADDDSPVFLPGGFAGIAAAWAGTARFIEAFRTGQGVGWHEQDGRLFRGTERFFRPGYKAHLLAEWIPALEAAEAKLQAGATVADVGCGHGASTILMAQAYPKSTFVGFDYHDASVDTARKRAAESGVGDRVTFEVASAKDYPGTGYDVIAFFDCLHDMGDPEGAVRHARSAIADDGTVLLVEPFAGDRVEDNLNPVGRAFYGFSTVICTMASKAQRSGWRWGLKPVRRRGGTSSPAPASPDSGGRRKRRSTSSSKRGPNPPPSSQLALLTSALRRCATPVRGQGARSGVRTPVQRPSL